MVEFISFIVGVILAIGTGMSTFGGEAPFIVSLLFTVFMFFAGFFGAWVLIYASLFLAAAGIVIAIGILLGWAIFVGIVFIFAGLSYIVG